GSLLVEVGAIFFGLGSTFDVDFGLVVVGGGFVDYAFSFDDVGVVIVVGVDGAGGHYGGDETQENEGDHALHGGSFREKTDEAGERIGCQRRSGRYSTRRMTGCVGGRDR